MATFTYKIPAEKYSESEAYRAAAFLQALGALQGYSSQLTYTAEGKPLVLVAFRIDHKERLLYVEIIHEIFLSFRRSHSVS